MPNFVLILLVAILEVVVSGERDPVSHDRVIRRCENGTHSWPSPYWNDTTGPWSAAPIGYPGSVSPWSVSPTEYSSRQSCASGGVPCSSTGTGVPSWGSSTKEAPTSSSAGENSTRSVSVSPEESTPVTTGSTLPNETSIWTSTIGTTESSSPSSHPVESNTATMSNASEVLPMTTFTTLSMTTTVGSFQNTSSSCQSQSGFECQSTNETTPWQSGGTSTGGPLWSNTSFSASTTDTSASTETVSLPEVETTLTFEITPSPLTPSPVTPSPQEITLTALIPGGRRNQTAGVGPNESRTSLNSTRSESNSITSSETPAGITMTIVVASNSTGIVSPVETSLPTVTATEHTNNTTTSSASSNTTGTESSTPPLTTATETGTNKSTVLGTPTSTETSTTALTTSTNTTVTGSSNEATTVTTSTTTDLSSTSSPYWTNTTTSTPCPDETPFHPWSDWNLTALITSSWINASTATATGSATQSSTWTDNSTITSPFSPKTRGSSEDQPHQTTPTDGTWFGLTTFSDGQVSTTFTTTFGLASTGSSTTTADGPSVSSSSSSQEPVVPVGQRRRWRERSYPIPDQWKADGSVDSEEEGRR